MPLLARSCAALALTALAAGVVTIAPAGVAAASGGGGIYGGTTDQQPGPVSIVKPVDTTGTETQPTSKKVRTPTRTTRSKLVDRSPNQWCFPVPRRSPSQTVR
jgi:hypothetical protein